MERNKNKKDEHIPSGPEIVTKKSRNKNYDYIIIPSLAVVIIGLLILSQFRKKISPGVEGSKSSNSAQKQVAAANEADPVLVEKVIPKEGVALPATWGNFGKQLVDKGVIDAQKFEAIYAKGGGLSEIDKKLLYGTGNGKIKITQENAGTLLNLLWAFGLGNKNTILEKGPMTDSQYGGAEKFASTGGWTISKGKAMNHYSKYKFVTLTPDQQAKVERVSKGIFRPCCGNSTYFPDCNHGMAMLGLLEIMASQGVSEYDMYRIALQVNSYWFPDTYLTLASYFEKQRNVTWDNVDPKEVLGVNYSSSSGYRNILQSVDPVSLQQKGGSCGV